MSMYSNIPNTTIGSAIFHRSKILGRWKTHDFSQIYHVLLFILQIFYENITQSSANTHWYTHKRCQIMAHTAKREQPKYSLRQCF